MQKDTTAKLAACEANLKRWQTRLKRATSKVTELDRLRRRLQAKMGPVNLHELIGPPMSDKDVGADQETVKPTIDVIEVKRQVDAAIGDDASIPPFLDRRMTMADRTADDVKRRNVRLADAAKLRAERKSKDDADKKKMPLTGRAALEAIRPKRKQA